MYLAIPLILVLNNFAFLIPNAININLTFMGIRIITDHIYGLLSRFLYLLKINAFLLLNIFKWNNINFIFTINNYGLLSLN